MVSFLVFLSLLAVVAAASVGDVVKDSKMLQSQSGTYSWRWSQNAMTACNEQVEAGVGADGRKVYLGRVRHFDNLLPGLVQGNYSVPAVYPLRSNVYTATSYEVLCGPGVAWSPVFNPRGYNKPLPLSAIHAGYLDDGTVLYACRTVVTIPNQPQATVVTGYVESNLKQCAVPYSSIRGSIQYNSVYYSNFYEVLVED